MPRRFPMSVIRDRVFKRAVMQGDTSIDATEANSLISEIYGSYVFEPVAGTGHRYFELSTQITTAGSAYIAEPADRLSIVDTIERIVNTTTQKRQRLYPIAPQERAVWSGRSGHARRWEIVDDRINLYPTPPAGDVYEIRYVQQPPDLTNFADTDVVDVVTPSGEAALIWGASLLFMSKDKSDVQLAMAERDKAVERLVDWAVNDLMNQPQRTYVEDDDGNFDPRAQGSYWYDR